MNNPILNAEQFQHAVSSFGGAIEDLRNNVQWQGEHMTRFENSVSVFRDFVERFEKAVERLILDGPQL